MSADLRTAIERWLREHDGVRLASGNDVSIDRVSIDLVSDGKRHTVVLSQDADG